MTQIKKAADLQEESNRIQAELADVIKKHNKMTSIQNWLMVSLTILIIVLTIFALRTNYNKTGRYAMVGGNGGVYVLDTKTSQLWIRPAAREENLDLGTNENPKVRFIELKDEEKKK